jgi:hypothetical protein
MNPLPSAPLTALPAAAPVWTGYPAVTHVTPGDTSRPVITREQLVAHLEQPAAWRALPDGTPLRLCAEGMEFILDDFGGYKAVELRSAHRLLFFATRTEAQMRALWVPPVPQDDAAEEPEILALHLRALQAHISAWAARTFAPDAFREVRQIGLLLWNAVMERMPVSAEKKSPPDPVSPSSPESDSHGSATCVGSSPEETPSPASACDSAPMSAPSSPTSSAGATTTGAPSSPSPPKPADSPPPAP